MEIKKKRFFLGNLPDGVSENDIRAKFERFGSILNVEIKVKKVNDGKESNTFGFIELDVSDVKLNECLRSTNGSDLGGLRLRVQVAKESFLDRLKAEREQSAQKQKPAAPASHAPQNFNLSIKKPTPETNFNSSIPANRKTIPSEPQVVQDYNPMQMFKNFKSQSISNEVTKEASPPKKEWTKPVDSGRFQQKQDWQQKTTNTLKKFGGTKSSNPAVEEEEEETGNNGSLMSKLENFSGMWNDLDEAPVMIDVTRKDAVETIKPEVKVEDPEELKRKELDNQKRIQSLQQRNEALKAQHSFIKSALSFGQPAGNRKIKFEDAEPTEDHHSKPKKSKTKKLLFDEEELLEELGSGDHFKSRAHLDGQTGQELLELQSGYGHDSRFKLDHRFTERNQNEMTEEDNNNDEEKQRQMSILGSLVPLAPTNNSMATDSSTSKNRIGSKAFVRFDPNVKDHVKFEKTVEKVPTQPGGRRKQMEDAADPVQSLPEVSADRYYTTTGSLDIGNKESGGFSLRQLFQRDVQVEEEEPLMEKEEERPQAKLIIKKDASGPLQQKPEGYWKNTGMWHEPLFLQPDDARFKEALDFLRGKPSDEAYTNREKWSEYRENLRYFYRNKARRHTNWASDNNSKRVQTSGWANDAEQVESSYHQYHDQSMDAKKHSRAPAHHKSRKTFKK